MFHPFQNIVATSTHLYATVQNFLYVINIQDGTLVGKWEDELNLKTLLNQKIQERQKLEDESEPSSKRAENNQKVKIPKIPVPGPGAPPVFNYIRSLKLTQDSKYLLAITDCDKSIVIFKLDFTQDNCLTIIKRQPFPKRPCSISIADNNKTAVIGDKFGDVYSIEINDDLPKPEKDLKPILGHVSMLTDVLVAEHDNKQFILTSDRDEHIKVSHYPQTFVVKHWLFGHDEFISSMVLPDFDKNLLITGGGDDLIFLWNWFDQKLISSFNLRPFVEKYLTDEHLPPSRFLKETSIREISVVRILSYNKKIIVLLENMKCIVSLNIDDDLTISLDKVKELDSPLVDIALSKDIIIGAPESNLNDPENGIIKMFNVGTLEDIETPSINIPIISVNSKEEFYPLYNMNYLRKRSEH